MSLHKLVLIASLVIFGIGTVWKISTWFRYSVGPQGSRFSMSQRIAAALKGVLASLFSPKVISAFFADALFQRPILREDPYRWYMHMSIFAGFAMLFVLHALDNYLMVHLYNGYAATLNPFLFLRDVGGALVVVGVIMAINRRFIRKERRPRTSSMDVYAIVMVALIILSGFLLESTKITSQAAFQRMADEYTMGGTDEDIKALEAYWSENFGVVVANAKVPYSAAVLAKGKEVHQANCEQCHAAPVWGFGGYAISVALRPLAAGLDAARLPDILTWVHYLACLFLLAYLPFSKMFHMIASPISLMASAAMGANSDPANVATRQMIELDACTHCGTCTMTCSVAVAINEFPNVNILPSEKIRALKKFATGADVDDKELRAIQQGVMLCTNCNRCGLVCPSGIQLRDLWFAARERLLSQGVAEPNLLSPLAYYRGLERENIDKDQYQKPLDAALNVMSGPKGRPSDAVVKVGEKAILGELSRSIQANSFSNCYRCGLCTNSCPVVRNYEHPVEELGLLPHQMMHAIGLRCWDLVFNSRMLWGCLGCYQCQENCPQCVSITDIMYELKNRAISRKNEELAI